MIFIWKEVFSPCEDFTFKIGISENRNKNNFRDFFREFFLALDQSAHIKSHFLKKWRSYFHNFVISALKDWHPSDVDFWSESVFSCALEKEIQLEIKNIHVKKWIGENSHVRAVELVASAQIWAPAQLYYSSPLLRENGKRSDHLEYKR